MLELSDNIAFDSILQETKMSWEIVFLYEIQHKSYLKYNILIIYYF